jgi:hypothetical protein
LGIGSVEFGQFLSDFGVNGLPVIVVVAEGGVDFCESEVRILAGDFLGRPAMTQMIGDDLCDANAGEPLQSGGFSIRSDDVRVIECGHGRTLAPLFMLGSHEIVQAES